MITIEGKSVFGGVSIGKLMFYKRNEKVIRRTHVDDVDAEWKRFEEAKNTAIDQLKDLYDKAIEDVGEANAMIFEIHQMMLDDLDCIYIIHHIFNIIHCKLPIAHSFLQSGIDISNFLVLISQFDYLFR